MQNKETVWHKLFYLGVLAKGLEAVVEVLTGIFVLFVTRGTLDAIFAFIVGSELSETPRDFLINYAYTSLHALSIDLKTFIALYILVHGIINAILVFGLYKEKLWAFPVTIMVEILLVLYTTYRFINDHSLILIPFIVFDVVVTILVWHEYQNRKKLNSNQI